MAVKVRSGEERSGRDQRGCRRGPKNAECHDWLIAAGCRAAERESSRVPGGCRVPEQTRIKQPSAEVLLHLWIMA
jgi:hypothetical protein